MIFCRHTLVHVYLRHRHQFHEMQFCYKPVYFWSNHVKINSLLLEFCDVPLSVLVGKTEETFDNSPVTITVRMSASLSWCITGVVCGFSVFSSISKPKKERSVSTFSLENISSNNNQTWQSTRQLSLLYWWHFRQEETYLAIRWAWGQVSLLSNGLHAKPITRKPCIVYLWSTSSKSSGTKNKIK